MAQKGVRTTADYLPYPEYIRLLECLRQDKKYGIWELYCVLAFATGLRASDVLSLKWEDILNKNYITKLEQKTQKTRFIKIDQSVIDRICQLHDIQEKPHKDSYAIENKLTGFPYSIDRVNEVLKVFKSKYHLKIRAFSSHTFRKTFGRRIYDEATDKSEALVRLQGIFDHRDAKTTMRYIALTQEDYDQAYSAIKI